jgi:hypothetical protein
MTTPTQEPSHAAKIDEVVRRYRAKNWTVFAPKNNINDVVAHLQTTRGDGKYHFVQIAPGRNISGFIQNAFSNGATPVLATIKSGKSAADGGLKLTVSFIDANIKNKVIV